MTQIDDGGDLYRALEGMDLLAEKPPMWWPGYGTFEVIIGAVLTQNSQWGKVERSLENLRSHHLLSPEGIADADAELLTELIRPSGLYRSKTNYLRMLCRNIAEAYGDFGTFCAETGREWLLEQKGVGPETADSILCYGCRRPVMVVDAYTARLVAALGWEIEMYDELQAWCMNGLAGNDEVLARRYALLHGMIVEYVKRNKRGRSVETAPLLHAERSNNV
jgi:endonuclease-3 related protein